MSYDPDPRGTSLTTAGRGIVSFVRTSGDGAPGTDDTYTITFTDDTTVTFTIHNGTDGGGGSGAIDVWDDGNDQGSATTIDFGTGLTVFLDPDTGLARIDVVAGASSGLVQDLLANPDWVINASIRTAVQNDVGQATVGRFTRSDRGRVPYTAGHRPRGGRVLSLPVSAGDYTKTGSGAVLGESTVKPLTYDRSVSLAITGTGVGTMRPTAALAPWDLTDGLMRMVVEMRGAWNNGAGPLLFQVSSDNFATGNYHQVTAARGGENLINNDRDAVLSFNFNEFLPVGLGADLSAVNQWRVSGTSAAGQTTTILPKMVEHVPAALPRALAVIGVDDSTAEMWRDMARITAAYGLQATIYACIGDLDSSVAGAGTLKYEHLRTAHDLLAAQVASHAFQGLDHNSAHFGDDLHQYHMRAIALRKSLGFYGWEDGSYYGAANVGFHFQVDDHYKLARKLYATCRGNFNHLRTVETLPLADPWNTRSYLLAADDTMDPGSDLRTYLDKGIEGKGLIEISSHNSNWTTYGAVQGVPLCQYLAQKQAEGLVDVVTKAEAMRRLALVAA